MDLSQNIEAFKQHVIEVSKNPDFLHHKWFIKYHLEIVEQIASELCDIYPDANRDLVMTMVWLHDYGKILDVRREDELTTHEGTKKLLEVWFPQDFVTKVIGYTEIMNQSLTLDISKTALEIQIISSADGCAHMVGPFLSLWWHENSHKDFEELMQDNIYKLNKDWNHKIVLPEARNMFEARYNFHLEKCWKFPEKYFPN